jgi:MFS family permease
VSILSNTIAGIASNCFDGYRARTIPMDLNIVCYMAGSSLGPVTGAAVLKYLPWRWTGHIELTWTAALFPLFVIALPESRAL